MNECIGLHDSSTAVCLLAQADLVFLLADLLRPPRPAGERWESAGQSLDELMITAGLQDPALAAAMEETLRQAAATPPAAWSGEYHRLFEGRLMCPPNESAYIRRDKGAILADICGFYRAFGFDFRPEIAEKPDHIVTELEFCGILLAMRAGAASVEQDEVTREALISFAETHLGEWLPWLAARLQLTAQLPVYQQIANALAAVWSALSAAHGLRAAPSGPMGQPEEEPDEPYDCGAVAGPAMVQTALPASVR